MTHSHGAEGEHSHTGIASHIWLDFGHAAVQARTLAAAMSRRMPELSDRIDANLADPTGDLSGLDERARAVAEGLTGTTVIASHPRCQYFARAYDLDIRALHWDAGASLTEAQRHALEYLAEGSGAGLMLWEEQPATEALELAGSTGLVSGVFPPLTQRSAEGDFLGQARAALDALAKAHLAEEG